MSVSDQLLRRVALRAGVHLTWRHGSGEYRPVGADTLRALLAGLGWPCESDDDARDALAACETGAFARAAAPGLVVAREGRNVTLPARGAAGALVEWVYEDGAWETARALASPAGALMLAAPSRVGYHQVHTPAGTFAVAVAPRRCPTFRDLTGGTGWGLAAQVYSLGAGVECGVGDFGGVAALARASARQGADLLAISPVHALLGAPGRYDSPYSPSTRLFLDPVYADPKLAFANLPAPAPRSERAAEVNWPAARRAKRALLEDIYLQLGGDLREAFEAYVADASPPLKAHALFEAIRERRPEAWDWRRWPEALRGPQASGARDFAHECAEDVRFQLFLQWACERSFAGAQAAARDAGMRAGLVADIPAGVDPAGSEVWARPDAYLRGVTMGAPPDAFTQSGQDWRLAAFSPAGLAAQGYAPWIDMLRANLRLAGGLRMDHVMGVQRLWLIPEGADPKQGAYVEYPAESLLRLVALEASRHRAFVLGEDLGTLPFDFQDYLGSHGVMGLRFLRLQHDAKGWRPPGAWTPAAAALTATHDTMATAGWWKDQPETDRRALWTAFRDAGAAEGDPPGPLDGERAVDAAFAFIGKTPCEIKLASLEDALATQIQPNVPGTQGERANWRLRYAADPAEALERPAVAKRLSSLGA